MRVTPLPPALLHAPVKPPADITGSSSAKTGVLSIYDIFGFFPQTQQGADIIASAGHLVVMPDMFEGTPLDINVYPPNTDEKKAAMQKFWVEKALPPGHIERVKTKIVPALKERFPSVEKWAVIGYCWGGKVSTLLSSEGTPFIASIQAHPALMDVEEAKQIVIPHLCIATADEKADVTKEYGEILKAKSGVVGEKSKVLYWGETFHGVMAARSNLKDEKHFEYYTKG